LLTLAGERAARFLLTIRPDFEKIRSKNAFKKYGFNNK